MNIHYRTGAAPAEVLVVEDSRTQAEGLRHLLEERGYSVTVVPDGRQALAEMRRHTPALVISDIVMPELDGYELCRQIRADESMRDLPVILLTSLSDPGDVIRGLESGADNFITKPYGEGYLLSRIQHILATRELRKGERVQVGVEIVFHGQRHFITSERQQILDLLISTYEAAVQQNAELARTRDELQALNERLEELVQARTAALAHSEARFRGLVEAAPDTILGVDRDGRVALVNDQAERTFGYPREAMLGQPVELLLPERLRDVHAEHRTGYLAQLRLRPMGAGLNLLGRRQDGSEFPVEISLSPVETNEGLLVMAIVHDITERVRAQQQIERQVQRLSALRTIDMAITASLDPRVTFGVILDQVTAQLHTDAADVLLYNPASLILEFAAGRGFRTEALRHTRLRIGEGHAGRAALERRVVDVPRLGEADDHFARAPQFAAEGFAAYFAVPLLAKGQVKGVLEVFHRTPLEPDRDWLGFLEALAGQAAIAIDNAALFDGLQRSNTDLTLAYNSTIEGWSRALDLRDRDTEGHTQRVTEMTLRLARVAGIGEDVLVHVRRGALLHDIGKMGVPDAILHKPGPLTAEEWAIMRRHPVYAHEMLWPIAYLRPALDIPYGHHEKWDGTGYPRGLAGEQIPLAARLFAVVDVWDALRSDRPYRPAWPEEQVREYIGEQSGQHFDPAAVEAFLRVQAEPG